jgi:hypothetical protein
VEVAEEGFAVGVVQGFDFGHGPSVHSGVAFVGSGCRYVARGGRKVH